MFCDARAEVVLGQFFFPDTVERVYNQGLNFANFVLPPDLVYNLFSGSKAEVVLGQFLVT